MSVTYTDNLPQFWRSLLNIYVLSAACTEKEGNLCCIDGFNRFISKKGHDFSSLYIVQWQSLVISRVTACWIYRHRLIYLLYFHILTKLLFNYRAIKLTHLTVSVIFMYYTRYTICLVHACIYTTYTINIAQFSKRLIHFWRLRKWSNLNWAT